MAMNKCIVCNCQIYILKDQPDICKDCEVCPICGERTTFTCSSEHDIYECEWCKHNFFNTGDLERDVKNYWISRAKAILGIQD